MRKSFKFLSLILTVVLSFGIVACGDGGNGGEVSSAGDYVYENGRPIVFADANGSDYKILLPEDYTETLEFAASELNDILVNKYGYKLDVVTDADLTDATDKSLRYVSIGKTKLSAAAGVDISATDKADNGDEFGSDGYVIKTYNANLILQAAGQRGNIYSVYGLCRKLFGYEVFAKDEIYYGEYGETVKLANIDFNTAPAFSTRELHWGHLMGQPDDSAIRFGLNGKANTTNSKYGENPSWSNLLQDHTSFILVPPSKYQSTHPEYYSATKKQLCLTNPDVLDILVENLEDYILNKEPDRQIFMVGQEDGAGSGGACTCESCTAEFTKYKYSGYWIRFVNKVADRIKEWETQLKASGEMPADRVIYIATFAYDFTEEAPFKYDSVQNKYVPIDETVYARDNMYVQICPIDADMSHPLNDEKHNKRYLDIFEQWSQICDNIAVWMYGSPSIKIFNMNNYSTMQENFRILKNDYNVKYMLYAGNAMCPNSTAIEDIRCYLLANFMWDIDQDFNELVEKFYTHYYKDVGDIMLEYFNMNIAHFAEVEKEVEASGINIFQYIIRSATTGADYGSRTDYYTYEYCTTQLDVLSKAQAIVDKIEDDAERTKLTKRLISESLTPRYFLIRLYNVQVEDIESEVDSWYEDAQYVVLPWPTLDSDLDTLYTEWKKGNYSYFM